MDIPHVCLTESLVNYHIFTLYSRKNLVIKFDDFRDKFALCWGSSQFFPQNSELAKRAGYCLERVVSEVFMSINQQNFNYIQITQAIKFFLTSTPEGNPSPIQQIVETVDELSGESKRKLKKQTALIQKLLRLAFCQHLFDPPCYVSHDFSHSLNVAQYSEKLYLKKNIQQYFLFNKQLGYHFKPVDRADRIAKGVLKLVAYLHDCGYPHLYEREKANHSIYSADKVDELKEQLRSVLANSVDNFDNFYKHFREAIFSHNADEISKDQQGIPIVFNRKKETTSGDFLFRQTEGGTIDCVFGQVEPGIRSARVSSYTQEGNFEGRNLDLFHKDDKILGLQKITADLKCNPFQIIRIADNLDFAKSRLTALQQRDSFKKLCLHHYKPEKYSLPDFDTEPDLREIKINYKSLRHFGGCMGVDSIEDIEYVENRDVRKLVVYIKTNNIYNQFCQDDFCFQEDGKRISISQYQLFRAAKAFKNITIDKQDFSLEVLEKKAGVSESVWPMLLDNQINE